MTHEHSFHALAFPENLAIRDIAPGFTDARRTPHELHARTGDGWMSIFPFGAVTFRDVAREDMERALATLRQLCPKLSKPVIEEDFVVAEGGPLRSSVDAGRLVIDRVTEARGDLVALVVAQSAAMEYYEKIVDEMFTHTARLVGRLERTGGVTYRLSSLHRFIGSALGTRSEVLSVLHLLDKPDATWDDPEMDRIYDELRAEFDLLDRYHALEAKLRSVQESLELVLDVVRDRRLFVLEAAIVVLILFEIVLSLVRAA
jgi:required for meiotic nuclear division protein 1